MKKDKVIEAAFESWWFETYSDVIDESKSYSVSTIKAIAIATWVASANRNN